MREVVTLFLKLGFVGFGGPAAHLALMEEEVVERRKWLDRQHFLDLVGLTNLIPGPNSTEMAIHIGYLRAGWRGLVAGGLAFLAPAALLSLLVAWLHGRYGELPRVQAAMTGIEAAVLAVIATAGWRLGRVAIAGGPHLILALALTGSVLAGANMVAVLFGGVALGTLVLSRAEPRRAIAVPLDLLFLVFLKIGAVLYGSGYVVVAFLEDEVVARGWITRAQLLDAVAVGQVTPGPLLSTATFIGYELRGPLGAALATLGIFLPSFVFVAILGPLARRLRATTWAGPFLAAVRVSAVALLLAVLAQLCRDLDPHRAAIAAAALVAGVRFRVAAHWLILASALYGAWRL